MSKVFDQDLQQLVSATKTQCPRCKGFGAKITDNGTICSLCKGKGILWRSASGWIRPINSSTKNSTLA